MHRLLLKQKPFANYALKRMLLLRWVALGAIILEQAMQSQQALQTASSTSASEQAP